MKKIPYIRFVFCVIDYLISSWYNLENIVFAFQKEVVDKITFESVELAELINSWDIEVIEL